MKFTKRAYSAINENLSEEGRLDLTNLGRILRKRMHLPHPAPTNDDYSVVESNDEDRLCKHHFVYHIVYKNKIQFTVIVKKYDIEDGPTVLTAYDFIRIP